MTAQIKRLATERIDALPANYKKPEDLISQHYVRRQFAKALVKHAMGTTARDDQPASASGGL